MNQIDNIMALAVQPEQEPTISTKHGPWVESKHPGEEGEKYCQRCLLRDKFLGSRSCDPHIVYTVPKPQPQQEAVALAEQYARSHAKFLFKAPQPQPEQEPVAWSRTSFIEDDEGRRIGTDEPEVVWSKEPPDEYGWSPLYTAAPHPQREWVGLTDEELSEIWGEFGLALMPVRKAIAHEIEAKLREKNT